MEIFKTAEVVTITGFERECDCSHCGQPLKVGVRLANFIGALGSDCLAKSVQKQTVGSYTFRVSAEGIKKRAIIAGKNIESRNGWNKGDKNFQFILKSSLKSI